MKQPELNRRLTSMDSAFLYLERKECPMHIGSTSIFESRLDLRDFTKHIEDRLHLVPRYLQKVTPCPFNIGHPTWEYAEDFDIKNHIFEIKSRKKLSQKDLIKIAGEKLTDCLDRNKPLWELYIVNNLEDGRSAMIAKVHHCMVDGISGVDLMKILFDISPEPSPAPPKPETETPKKETDPTRLFFDSMLGAMQEGMDRMLEAQGGLMYMASTLANPQMAETLPQLTGVLPAISTPPPILPFNGECSGERRLAWSEISYAEARAIRTTLNGTVNDVVLTVLSEAVARYVKHHNQPIENKFVRFMVPVSLRQKEQRGALGNLISVLPVEIPLDITDLTARFKHVNQKTAIMKSAKLAEGLLTLGAMYSMMPATIQSALGAIANLPFPPFNMVATNVPGPQIPLYMCGTKMLKYYPYVPIGFQIGLGCAILSYNQTLYFGLSSDAKAMSDVEKFKEILDEVFADLKATVEDLNNKATGANA
jgi:diacylglycerol O-acyltransferase / wax synthase